MKYIIGIDPGLGGTGVAIYTNESGNVRLERTHNFHYKDDDFLDRVYVLQVDVGLAVEKCYSAGGDRPAIIIEFQEMFQSVKSHMAHARGDITKLTFLTGAIFAEVNKHHGDVRLVKPSEWKGQLSKEMTRKRVLAHPSYVNRWPSARGKDAEDLTEHEIDAMGLALASMDML